MATLQKFRLLTTQCGVVGSPTLSPTTSPVVHFRRRKSFRSLLSCHSGHRSPPRRDSHEQQSIVVHQPEKNKKDMVGHSLKDLFLSSPQFEDDCNVTQNIRGEIQVSVLFPSVTNGECRARGPAGLQGGLASPGPVCAGFRHRLLRRAWRPVLATIPE